MTKQSTTHRGTADTQLPFPPLPALEGSFLHALIHNGEAYAKACLEWQQEVLRFASSRLQWDGQVGDALAKCKTFEDVAEVQKNWAMTTAQDYFNEANRLVQIATKCIPSWMPCVAPGHGGSKPETAAAAE